MTKSINETNFRNAFNVNMIRYGMANTSAAKSVEDTELRSAFVVNANSAGYTFGNDDRPDRVIKSFFAATAAYLSKAKVSKTDEATALVLTDAGGGFKFAGIVEYHENETPDEPGNWSFVMTFNEEDLKHLEKKKAVHKILYGGTAFKSCFDKVAYDVGSIEFQHENYLYDACLIVIDTLVSVLDREAKVGEVVEIEMPGYFVASVAVEGDEKVMSITPDGSLKAVIKEDIALEK